MRVALAVVLKEDVRRKLVAARSRGGLSIVASRNELVFILRQGNLALSNPINIPA